MLKKTLGLLASAAMVLGVSQVASAADMAVKALPPPAPIWTWTGFYIGAHVGAGWGTTESTLTQIFTSPPPTTTLISLPFSQDSRSGFLGGAQAGYNWQAGWAVFGVQADIAGTDIKGTTPCLLVLSCSTKTDWLATVSGRLGAVVLDRGLIYVKGGGAWMESRHSVKLPFVAGGGGVGLTSGQELTSRDSTAWGWMLGFGTEWMFARNWTAFIEYDYIEFDKKNEAFNINVAALGAPAGSSAIVNADLKNKLSIAKVGVNYKFDWGTPVVARY
jgi:outer membrane immunogenic protein